MIQIYSWKHKFAGTQYDFMLYCMSVGGVMKRLCLAINDRAGILDIPH